jgi:hypothetical protein
MVKMVLGKPTEIISRSTVPGDEEIWIYRKGGEQDMTPMMSSPMIGMGPPTAGVGITMGRGGPTIGTNAGMGMGTGMGTGSGVMMPTPMPPTPVEEREVVFRNGVVYRADSP